MSTDAPLPDRTSRPLLVTLEPAAGTIVVPSDDPYVVTVKVPVQRVPVSEIGAGPTKTIPPAEPTACAMPPLPDDVGVCHRMILELLDALKKEQHEREGLQQRLDLLLRRLYGPKAERFDPNQPWLFPEFAPTATPAEATASAPSTDSDTSQVNENTSKPKPKGHGRKPLPKDLPRRRLEHTLPEAQRICPCCGEVCAKFAEESKEQLDYQPASLFIWQHVRFKYACQKCHDHVTVAPRPWPSSTKAFLAPVFWRKSRPASMPITCRSIV